MAIKNTIEKTANQNENDVFFHKEQRQKNKLTQKGKYAKISQRYMLGSPVPPVQADDKTNTGDGNETADQGKRKPGFIKVHRNIKRKHPDKK